MVGCAPHPAFSKDDAVPLAAAFKTSAGAAQGAGVRAGAEAGAIAILQRNGQPLGRRGNGNTVAWRLAMPATPADSTPPPDPPACWIKVLVGRDEKTQRVRGVDTSENLLSPRVSSSSTQAEQTGEGSGHAVDKRSRKCTLRTLTRKPAMPCRSGKLAITLMSHPLKHRGRRTHGKRCFFVK